MGAVALPALAFIIFATMFVCGWMIFTEHPPGKPTAPEPEVKPERPTARQRSALERRKKAKVF